MRTALAVATVIVGVGGAALTLRPPPREKPTLLLMTSLPLLFGERFGLESVGSPVLARLEQSYDVEPIAAAEPAALAKGRLLLMAHPRAQPAELLVALDDWVRGSGRLLLLADPKLDWPSQRPLGDMLRPPPYFADTGLLQHWGLALDQPGSDKRSIDVDGRHVVTDSPGRLRSTDRQCSVSPTGLVARCGIGRGRVVVVADADFLNQHGKAGNDNLEFLIAELDSLAARD